MPLSTPKSGRKPLHRRVISVQGYLRDDGLYDIEGHLCDTKAVDFKLQSGMRAAGTPIHEMWLRLTINQQLDIVDAEAVTDAMPYEGACDQIVPEYRALIGLSIRPGFTYRIRELFGGTRGCTHITDLIGSVATTAFQTLAGQIKQGGEKQPFQLDRCHALRVGGDVVAQYYPRWHVKDTKAKRPKADS